MQKSFIDSPSKPHLKCISQVVILTLCLYVGTSHYLIVWQEDSNILRSDPNFTAQVPSENILRAGRILRNAILARAPHMIRDRKYHLKTYRLANIFRCKSGMIIFVRACIYKYAFPIGDER